MTRCWDAGRAWTRWGSRVGIPTFTRQRGMIRSGVLIRAERLSLVRLRYRCQCINQPPVDVPWYNQSLGELANQVFVQPVVRTAQFTWDVPNAFLDSEYQPANPAFRAYLNGQMSYGQAWGVITLDAANTVMLTANGLQGARQLLGGGSGKLRDRWPQRRSAASPQAHS